MRRWAAFGVVAAALAACRSGPPAPAPGGRAEERAPAPPASEARAEPPPALARPRPGGDRHARAAARRTPVVKRVDGIVADRDERTLYVARPGAPALPLRIAPGTTVTLDGRPARADELPSGADVRAAYRAGDGERPTAIAIEARRPPTPAGAGEAGPAPAEAPAASPWEASPEPTEPGGG